MKFINNIAVATKISKGVLDIALDFVYPPRCISCHELLAAFSQKFICSHCSDIFVPVPTGSACTCGLPKNNCGTCGTHVFAQNTSAFFYHDLCKDIIYKFKYAKKPFMAKGMATLMATALDKSTFCDIDYIIPVPIHKNRLRSRGFNQAQLLAQHLSNIVGISTCKNALQRAKDTKPLANFSPGIRENVLINAFIANKKQIQNKRILLIDDIYTTGSTLNACAKVLYENDAAIVKCATFAIVPTKNIFI